MKRTVLYYPTISIPDGPWLRRALFYFDEVASIVPRTVFYPDQMGPLLIPTSPEVDFLLRRDSFARFLRKSCTSKRDGRRQPVSARSFLRR